MYCKHCGKLIDDDSMFCKHCGKKQIESKFLSEDEMFDYDHHLGLTKKEIVNRVNSDISRLGLPKKLVLSSYQDHSDDVHWYKSGCMWFQYK